MFDNLRRLARRHRGIVRTLASLLLVLFLLQFVRPEFPAATASTELQTPSEVKNILKQSCYPCHSNERRLSWFDEIVPGYWLVVHDVKTARRHLNFSELGAQPAAVQRARLFEAFNFIRSGEMPLHSYARVHPHAAVSQAQRAVLQECLHPTPVLRSLTTAESSDSEYRKWLSTSATPASPELSPNGIAFPSDYRNWRMIDSTIRFDSNTMRVILGNAVAMKAIADHRTNPWPDGATFAKVGWYQLPDEGGLIRAGSFLKVGFMTKGETRYASTAGWGWAEWAGVRLKPADERADFANDCVACHTPLRKNDYVYTMPIHAPEVSETKAALNTKAVVTGSLPVNPLTWRIITSGADPRHATMFTLFGNDEAVEYSRRSADGKYPAGSTLSLVTWRQQDDPHWFGATMPAEPKSVEFVFTNNSAGSSPAYTYRLFHGDRLREAPVPEDEAQRRINYLTSQHAAVMP